MTAAPALEAAGVAWSWPGAARPALDGVSLTLAPGTFTALVGPNGSGKSTLLSLLAGVRAPAIGEVKHDGASSRGAGHERLALRVAFLPGRPVAPPELTGLEVTLLGRHPFGRGLLLEREEDVRRADAALARAGAAAFRDRPIGELSSGERQRVLVARTLCQDVGALLLDEPTSAQDPAHALDLFALFAALAREGRTVVVATHDLNGAARFADRLVALAGGRVVADGTPSEVLAAGPLAAVFDVEAVLGRDAETPYAVPRGRASEGDASRRQLPASPGPSEGAAGAPVPTSSGSASPWPSVAATSSRAPGSIGGEGRGTGVHPALPLAAAAALLLLVLWLAPLVSSSGLAAATEDLHRPRAVLGVLAGCALAACGVVLQAVLRNPLAEPYTLGIASGAAVGAALAIQVVPMLARGGDVDPWSAPRRPAATAPAEPAPARTFDLRAVAPPPTFLGAFVGAALAAALVYAIASSRDLAAETLLLAGVAVALFCGAVVAILHFLASTIDVFAMLRWTMGSLSTAGYDRVLRVAPFVALGLACCAAVATRLAPASLDDDSARGLGVDPVRVRRLAFLGTGLATAGVVASTGPIGFIGLVVPHVCRGLVGHDPRVLLPVATLAGGATLAACDVLARTLVYPTELPISVITHAFGCPAFVWILVRRR